MSRLLIRWWVLFSPLIAQSLDVSIEAPAAILMNADSGVVLFERNAEEAHYPASITKIATALYLIENKGDVLDEFAEASSEAVAAISPEAKRKQRYRQPSHWLEFGSSHIGLKKGERMTLRSLLDGLMLESGNDAANVIAEHLSGDVPTFISDLNARLAQIGCRHTHFTNPHGLHHPDHVTTARDMAVMTREALKYPMFREVVSALTASRPKTNLQEATQFRQYNKLLRPGKHYYPKAIGVKTGYTSDAGSTLVAAAEDGERTLIAVVLGCDSQQQRFEDTIRLFDAAFREEKVTRRVLSAGPQSFACRPSSSRKKLTTRLAHDVTLSFYPSETPDLHGNLVWATNLAPPIVEGSVVGEIQVLDAQNRVWTRAPLLAANTVRAGLGEAVKSAWGSSGLIRKGAKTCALVGVVGALIAFLRRRR